ncbi:hypothetical protein M758_5G182500 [Ceratodon purpureus]|nr:hypothetical protein M758_5G182500 [Ceratodon purpureus]
MVKKRKQKEKNSRGVAAMEDDTPSVADREAVPESNGGGEAMETADVEVAEPTGAELDLLQSKKKRKKKGSKSNGLQIQGYLSCIAKTAFISMLES